MAKRNKLLVIRSYVQVAEGGLNEITNIIIRMRELSFNQHLTHLATGRGYLDKEFQQLSQEVATTNFST